ncbi:HyaD/HybD family hydrogenase maturation endopeptidase [Cocleimonas flava]|uniref:Hydrogenase 1 maturation peptidase HyaD n=1 Tax=Cocleimonas flava TaxID=634765 RepID=A0A4R1F2J7_9GAMM|nr:HyaD/HybD family hydrogenase maturation endopeptidase [Cocleimonas flava]TCJ88386.1 hydrogenase 1 maturation peptidase HyaD [Cocleimonas flava]
MTSKKTLILGIGNVLWADEGFGVRCVEAINRKYEFSENVELMDGGTQGIYLVQHVQACDYLIVFDAIDYNLEGGTMKIIQDKDVPNFMGAKKMSLHQTGFQEVLSTAELLDDYPEKILLIGVQPVELEDFGGSLRPAVKSQIEPAINIAINYLKDLGIECKKRTKPLAETEALSPSELALEQYENGRPSAEKACRTGDERILSNKKMKFDPKAPTLENPLAVDVDYRGQYD